MAFRKNSNDQTMKRYLSAKTLKNGCSKQDIKAYFCHSYEVYEKLFSLIREQKSFYTKPEPLRHPLIFYYGHTACVYINKLYDKGLISQRINPKFQTIFAVGVDEMDWDDLNDTHYDWPSVRDVTIYREVVKNIVLGVIDKINPQINWQSDAWVIMMGIEHQKIHLQTSSVIIRRLPIQEILPNQDFIDCPRFVNQLSDIPENQMMIVPAFKQEWNRQRNNTNTYGWDNQFGEKLIDVNTFKASSMLVSNGQYLQFVEDGGYKRTQFWDQQGKAWLKSIKPTLPLFWSYKNGSYSLRTMSTVMPLPYDWPAQVNNLQATAFCNWKSSKTGRSLRLPTEDQYFALRDLLPGDHTQWGFGQAGNLNMEYWFSPNPVNYFKVGDFYDIVGNVWQHTATPIYPFKNFQYHPIYEDFSTPTFDGRHYLIKGGSFISTGNEAIKHSRYAFRRHFYQFAGFRYVQSTNSTWSQQLLDESDKVVEKFLKIHYLTPNSYPQKVCETVVKKIADKNLKCLTVGCSVGRIVLQLSKSFQFSFGTDYSARFFQMATRLYEKGFLKYKDIDIVLGNQSMVKQKTVLYQMNPENPDTKKLNSFDVAIFDGFALKQNTIKKVLKHMRKTLNKNAKIILISNQSRNSISLDQLRQIVGKAELIESIVVPQVKYQDFSVNIDCFEIQQAW